MSKNKGYIFVSNGTKPSKEVYESLEPIGPSSFSYTSLSAADKLGWQLHMGINRLNPDQIKSLKFNIKFYNQHSFRNIFALKDNWIAYKNLCTYLKNNPQIEIIHCNTPIGGVVGRLAGRKFNRKVIYTAHGFHFFKGAPLFNRTILKWIEQLLAHYTDILITINEEDYLNALKMKLKPKGKIFKVPGVGIDLEKFNSLQNKVNFRESLGLQTSDFVCITLGDLNINKNHSTVINAISQVKSKNIHYLICGKGPLEKELKIQASKLGLEKHIHFLGYRTDVPNLIASADCAIISSLREGLPRSTMEAMASGLPCIVSNIRGNRDLIEDGKGGFLVNPTDSKAFANAISKLIENPDLRKHMGEWNLHRIKDFDIETIKAQMYNIFKDL